MTRFRPEHAGILNLWHFAHQVFPFADGRLVLRGDNGSGKTKALELLFPFVLDGSLDPRRLDPFSSDGRRMRDNLVAAANASGASSATGYAWMTFARPDGEHLTVGMGVSGGPEREKVDRWSFVTPRVPGVDLALVDGDQRPLSRRGLLDRLGPDAVFDTVEGHRRAVDARLFGLGEERYLAMLDLVLQLRKPKLAALLDPDRISALLSDSLRPVDGDALHDVAKGLEELERIADELAAMRSAAKALEALHVEQRSYLRTHARLRLDVLRGARSGLLDLERDLEAANLAVEAARLRADAASAGEEEARHEHAAAVGQIDGLRASDAYRAGQSLYDRRATVRTLEGRERELRDAARRAADRKARSIEEATSSEDKCLRLQAEVDTRAHALAVDAPQAVGVELGPSDGELAAVEAALRALIAGRKHAIDEVAAALRQWQDAQTTSDEAHRVVDRARAREDEAQQAVQRAQQVAEVARTALAEALAAWHAAHDIVTDEDHSALRGRLLDGGRDDVAALGAALAERHQPRLQALAGQITEARAQVEAAERALAELRALRARVANAQEDAPAASPWRTPAPAGRPGAPLWRLVDFHDHLDPATRASLEAALLAAGLLDAWVSPVDDAPLDDARLVPGPAVAGPSLAALLRPDGDAVASTRVAAILAAIPLGALDTLDVVIDPAGGFRFGPLRGAWTVERARYIGATARETERQRRLSELDAQIGLADRELHERVHVYEGQIALRDAYALAAASLPPTSPVVTALDAARKAEDALSFTIEHRHEAEARAAERTRAAADALAAVRRLAAARQLPADEVGLREARARLDAFIRLVELQLRGLRELPEAVRRAAAQRAVADQDAREATEAAALAERASEQAGQERAALDAIEASQGADIRRVNDALAAAERAAKRAAELTDIQRRAAEAARVEVARFEERATALTALRPERTSAVDAAQARVQTLLKPAFALLLGLATVWEDEALAMAALASAAGDAATSEPRQKHVQTAVLNRFDELTRTLGSRLRCHQSTDDSLLVIEVEDEGREPSAVYAHRLGLRLAEQEGLLEDRERAVFEDQLLGTVCNALFSRLTAARSFAEQTERELARRPLSSGVRFGLRWIARKDLDPHEQTLLEVLRRDADHLGASDLDRVRAALRTALRTLRNTRPQADHREMLDLALDYRRWHRFQLQVHRPGQPASELTRQRHAQLSGGEKAAALYAPLFAAAQATFGGGHSFAPHLIALDEAFEGIDAQGRPELLAITVAFDLDLLLTGYDLWLTDAAVPAAMHAHLHHSPVDRVAVAELVRWDGRVLEDVPAPLWTGG